MSTPPPEEVTRLLLDWGNGDEHALARLTPLVCDELHRLAGCYMRREPGGQTLQTTALVNEAYLRLVDQTRVHWQNRAHFFAIAAQMMRRILVDHARSRHYAKRGGGARPVSLDAAPPISAERAGEPVELDDALASLARIDPRKARVVELRFFGGLSVEETAELLRVSPNTVMRDLNMARAWLYREITEGKGSSS